MVKKPSKSPVQIGFMYLYFMYLTMKSRKAESSLYDYFSVVPPSTNVTHKLCFTCNFVFVLPKPMLLFFFLKAVLSLMKKICSL